MVPLLLVLMLVLLIVLLVLAMPGTILGVRGGREVGLRVYIVVRVSSKRRNAILAPSWSPLGVLLGPFWGPLGAHLGSLGALLGLFGEAWEASWGRLGPHG